MKHLPRSHRAPGFFRAVCRFQQGGGLIFAFVRSLREAGKIRANEPETR